MSCNMWAMAAAALSRKKSVTASPLQKCAYPRALRCLSLRSNNTVARKAPRKSLALSTTCFIMVHAALASQLLFYFYLNLRWSYSCSMSQCIIAPRRKQTMKSRGKRTAQWRHPLHSLSREHHCSHGSCVAAHIARDSTLAQLNSRLDSITLWWVKAAQCWSCRTWGYMTSNSQWGMQWKNFKPSRVHGSFCHTVPWLEDCCVGHALHFVA